MGARAVNGCPDKIGSGSGLEDTIFINKLTYQASNS